jgi:hypothetical protein
MANAKTGDDNPFLHAWRVSLAPLRISGQTESIGHPFGRTGLLTITANQDGTLHCVLDPDVSGQDYEFTAQWWDGESGAPASMTGDVETGGRTYRFFAYLRPDPSTENKGVLLGQLVRLPRAERSGKDMEDPDADGSWIGGDDDGGGEEDPR